MGRTALLNGHHQRQTFRDERSAVGVGRLKLYLPDARTNGEGLPHFIEREFRAFLRCGVLVHGFLRTRASWRETGAGILMQTPKQAGHAKGGIVKEPGALMVL